MSKRPKKMPRKLALYVEILEAKPNKMFTEFQHQTTKFLRYSKAIACAECGKKRRLMWTQLFTFRCHNLVPGLFSTVPGKIHAPLTPVCGDHPLAPVFEEEK